MSWRVVLRPEVWADVEQPAEWFDTRVEGLGTKFVEEIISVLGLIESNPLLNSRRHRIKNIRWRYPRTFPFRVIYEVVEKDRLVIVAAVLHSSRHDRHWKRKI